MGKGITDEQLIEAFDLVFSSTHSDGFKKSEMQDLIFDESYWFLEQPKEGWLGRLVSYLRSIEFNIDETKLGKYKHY